MWNRGIRLDPNDEWAHYNRACAYSQLDQREDAIADLKRAIDLDPKCREKAKTDPDFAPLRSDPDVRELVGVDPDQPAHN